MTNTTLTDAQAQHWKALPVLMAGTFVIVLDFFIVNVALPAIQRDLHTSSAGLEWVVASYGLAFASVILAAGRLGDQIGRRRLFTIGLGLFTLASLACGLAPDTAALIVARTVQGVAAGVISPSVLSMIGVLFPGQERARAIGVYAIVMGLGSAGGQLLGGALVQANIASLTWRAVFLVNIPVGVWGLWAVRRRIPETKSPAPRPNDYVGTLVATAGLVALVLPLIDGRQQGWPMWTWLSLAGGVALMAGFAVHQMRLERRGASPPLDPALFRTRTFSAGLATQLIVWCGQASYFLVLALYLQDGRGLNPLEAGGVFTILAGAYLIASLRAPRLVVVHGRTVVAAGACCLVAGHALMLAVVADIGVRGSVAMLAPALVLVGAGQGLTLTPLTSIVMMSSDPTRAGAVSGMLSTMQQFGNSLGVAITGAVFFAALPGRGVGHAFEMSLLELVAMLAGALLLTRLLPNPRSVVPPAAHATATTATGAAAG